MTKSTRADLITRDTILMLLTDDETARVSTAEAASGLVDGAEYLDLEHIDQGVRRANTDTKATMGHVLPRSAVSAETWGKILTHVKC